MQNPYPKDVFKWDNKDKLEFNRGRFNQHCFEVWENCKNDILKLIDEDEWKCGRNMEECACLLKKRLNDDPKSEQGEVPITKDDLEKSSPELDEFMETDEQKIKKEIDKDYE